MNASLKILPVVPFCACMPWHAREDGQYGAACCYCDRAVAAPEAAKGKHVACIYCAMDRGQIPEMEIEP